MSALLLLAAILGSPALAAAGRIHGLVKAEPRVEPKAAGGGAYADRSLAAATLFDYKHLKNVVVYAESVEEGPAPAGAAPPAGGAAEISVAKGRYGLELRPGFAVVRAGGVLRWRNATAAPVHVFAGGEGELGATLGAGESADVRVAAAAGSSFRLFCLEEAAAGGMLLVTGPHFARAGPDGRYALELPAGRYKITAWHYRLPALTLDVDVEAGADRTLDLNLTLKRLPEVP